MCRSELPQGTGMLFTYDALSGGGYWMFNTYVPLDIIYIGLDRLAVGGARMRPCPRGRDEAAEAWRSRCAADAAAYVTQGAFIATLELPAGWLAANGLGEPDQARIAVTWE